MRARIAGLGLLLAAGCQLLAGVDDKVRPPPESGTGGDAPTSTASSGGIGGAGGDDCGLAASDLDSDPENCGRCAHSCLGGACVGARCKPAVFADTNYFPVDIAVDADTVYWIDYWAYLVEKKPKNAARAVKPKPLAKANLLPTWIVVDGLSVLWSEYGAPSAVWTVPKAGGQHTPFLKASYPGPIAVGTNAYFITASDEKGDLSMILRVPKDGGTPVLLRGLSDQAGSTTAIATDGDFVYFTDAWGLVGRVAAEGGGPTEIVDTNVQIPWAVAVDSEYVFYCDANAIYRKKKGTPAESPSELLATTPLPCGHMAIDDTYVYITAAVYGRLSGFVARVEKSGAKKHLESLGTYAEPAGITTDSVAVYWTSAVDAKIWRLAK